MADKKGSRPADDSVMSRILAADSVKSLSRRDNGYLQVVLSEFSLYRTKTGQRMEIEIANDPPTIVERQGKQAIEEESTRNGKISVEQTTLYQDLQEFQANTNSLAYRFDCSNWPMRFANGGVLPILQLNGTEFVLMFYRDIFPFGWNIANGASDNVDEWVNPRRIIQREFGEEVLLCDPTNKQLFIYDPPGEARPVGFHEEAIAAWTKRRPEYADYQRVPIPLKWIEGPDSIRVKFRDRDETSDKVFLSATPADHGIEIDHMALIRLNGDIICLDGEISGDRLHNHVVGLFELKYFPGMLSGTKFLPQRVFFDGMEYQPQMLDEVIGMYLKHLQESKLRDKDQIAKYEKAKKKFNLCPISREVIGRYFKWVKAEEEQTARARESMKNEPVRATRTVDSTKPVQIFISHRSKQIDHARALHEFLTERDHRVFFADESLARLGESDYENAIGNAIDHATIFVLLALDVDDLKSGWVDFEWKAFHCELASDRKPGGQLFTLLHNIAIKDLPLPLRSRQSIAYSPTSPFDSFENLYRYIKQALEEAAKSQA